jgi:hypothetical protein
MAFDSSRGRTVLFPGGRDFASTTWEWDGVAWLQVATTGPVPRQGHAMVYDSHRGRTVLFGGYTHDTWPNPAGGDTWEWDGTTWTQLAITGPAPRYYHAMAFDSRRHRVVLYSGLPNWTTPFAYFEDLWELVPVGDPCDSAATCDSGFCVDGVCCAVESCGLCERCDASASPGTCTAVRDAEDPDTCAGAASCDADGVCVLGPGHTCAEAPDGPACTCDGGAGHCLGGACVCDAEDAGVAPIDAGSDAAQDSPGDAGLDGRGDAAADAGTGGAPGGCACRSVRGARDAAPWLVALAVVFALRHGRRERRRAEVPRPRI